MKKNIALLLALALTLGMLAGCNQTPATTTAPPTGGTTTAPTGGGTTATPATQPTPSANEITDLVSWALVSNEVATWIPQYSQNGKECIVFAQNFEALLTNDQYGRLLPALAESWSSDTNSVVWTFNLRKGVMWADQKGNPMAEIVAEDFLWGLEWTVNFWKNDSNNASMPMDMIKGCKEYYEYTKALDSAASMALGLDKFLEMVSVRAVDTYTIEYTAVAPMAYFDTLGTYNCVWPISAKLLEKIGADGYKAATPETLWYSGPYTTTTFVQNNEKVFTKNPLYWDTASKRFNTVTVKMVESTDIAFQLFQNGEVDHVDLSASNLEVINNNTSHQYNKNMVEKPPSKYMTSFHFNFARLNEDGTEDTNWNMAVANEAFRLTWYYGYDRVGYLRRINPINPIKCAIYAYSAPYLSYTKAGVDYVQLVHDRLGVTPSNDAISTYDKAKFEQYKAQAIQELTAKGVTFPVVAHYWISSTNQTALDNATVLKQTVIDSLGADFIDVKIDTYISSHAQEVSTPRLAGLGMGTWGADYGDPLSFVSQELYGYDNAYFAVNSAKINFATDPDLIATYKEFTALAEKADAISNDMDARLNAFADAEAYMIEHALVIPLYTSIVWELTHINDYSKVNAPYGIIAYRYINWETSKDLYTTEDYAGFAAAYEAGKK